MKAKGYIGLITKGTPARGLAGATLGFFIGFAAVSLFGPTAKSLRGILGLSPLEVGLLVAAPSLSGSLLRIPFSAWVDTTGGRKPFLVLLFLSIAGMAGLFLTLHFYYPERMPRSFFPLILFLGVLCGCGIATFSVGISQVAYWYPKARHGTALGTYAGIGNLAPGIFTLLLPFALVSMGLAGSYLAWLAFLIAGTGLYAVVGRNAWYFQMVAQGVPVEEAKPASAARGQEIFPAGNLIESLLLSARIWKTWALVAVYFTTFGGFIALTAWLPVYWISFYAVTPVVAGTLAGAYSILTSLVRVGGGYLSDRLGGELTGILALCFMLVGALMMTLSGNFRLSVVAGIFLAIGMGVTNAAVFKLVAQEVPEAVGGAAGWVGGLGAFGGFAIPPILGTIVEIRGAGGYASGFVVFVGLAAISLLLVGVLRQKRARVFAAI
ncbi:MAG TPA: MFS transporter [Candidatus Deferrimicrobiaceae bacterium]|nr:MFS transporter [Candidatus Deferrimicrobiaceae bacterium]